MFYGNMKNSIQNLITNLGTGKDKKNSTKFVEKELTSDELIAMYRSDWLGGKIIDVPVEDMLRNWISIISPESSADDLTLIDGAIKNLKVKSLFEYGLKFGGLYGGELLYMHLDGDNPEEELDVETVSQGKLLFLKLIEKENIGKVVFDEDIESKNYGEVESYEINKKTVHASRCLRFDGILLPRSQASDGWSVPLLQRYYDAIKDPQDFTSIVSSMGHEAKKDIVKVPALMQMLTTTEGTEKVIDRFQNADMIKSINNMLILDDKESYAQTQIAFGGLDAILKLKYHIASSASDIPVIRLIGTSATGLNGSGETDLNNYYDMLSSRQESRIRPELEKLFEVLVRSTLGSMPKGFSFTFNPLWQPTPAQQAEMDLKASQRDNTYLVNQVLLPSIVLKELQKNGTYSGITDEYIQAVEEVEGVEGDVE